MKQLVLIVFLILFFPFISYAYVPFGGIVIGQLPCTKPVPGFLLLIKTPPVLASTHLGFINEFGAIASAVGAMSNTLSNPILGLSGVSQYQKSLKNTEDHMKYVGSLLNTRGIVFKKGENGYLFTSLFERSR